ncbi:SMI1/KNR4 family protein [Cardiobacteriaceae bacterium TAE3-ERU3]|nr:SMI1/KNR4 family protein [Cardiobacteriaceae bacterium TAE3-ERU3]
MPLNPFSALPDPDGSLAYFEQLKELSEAYWAGMTLDPNLYGLQIQPGTRWRDGLDEQSLDDFQQALGMTFPEDLKNYYRTMNGLDKPAINLYGTDGSSPIYRAPFYAYPDDLDTIKSYIHWIYESNGIDGNPSAHPDIPQIFPVCGHRFLILDGRGQVLSMYGDDIIFWADNICKLLACEIFSAFVPEPRFNSDPQRAKSVRHWLESSTRR